MPNPARRSERALQAILDATGELIRDQGLAATSIDQIAERAGVGKQTIYRWWPNKAALVLAYAQERARPVREPDTGSLDGDLRQLARDLTQTLSKSPAGRCLRRADRQRRGGSGIRGRLPRDVRFAAAGDGPEGPPPLAGER